MTELSLALHDLIFGHSLSILTLPILLLANDSHAFTLFHEQLL
jgi:hypothetical protein